MGKLAEPMHYGIFVYPTTLKITDELIFIYFYHLSIFLLSFPQVPYYLAELTEKIAHDDRIPILKASQAKLKVRADLLKGNTFPQHPIQYYLHNPC